MSYKKREEQLCYQRKWYRENRAKVINWVKTSKRRRESKYKDFILNYMGGRCKYCKTDDKRVLTWHHIKKRNGKERCISTMICGKGIKEILKECKKCELVCFNCHRIKELEKAGGRKNGKKDLR